MPSIKTLATMFGVSLVAIGCVRSNVLGVGALVAKIFPAPPPPSAG